MSIPTGINLRSVELFSFKLGADSEDPSLYASLLVEDKLNNTLVGKWAKENDIPVKYHIDNRDIKVNYFTRVRVTAHLTNKQATEFYLKYAEN